MNMVRRTAWRIVMPIAVLCGAQVVSAQADDAPAPANRFQQTTRTAGNIAVQPARDIGARKVTIPPVLQGAIAAPYGTAGASTCGQIGASLRALNGVLGPDFVAGAQTNENRASKIAEAGGKTIVNSLIPFRGLVREVSGAAPAQRRLNAAIDAGYARRGFLRGLAKAKGCRIG